MTTKIDIGGEMVAALQYHHYLNGYPCLVLVDNKTGQRICVATTNLARERDDDVVYIQREDIMKALQKAKILRDTGERVTGGLAVCKLI